MSERVRFLELVTNNIGRLNSRAMTRSYFMKHNAEHLWGWFIDATHLYSDLSLTQRIHVLRSDIHTSRPKCRTCSINNITFLDKKMSEYCSARCAQRDNKISVLVGMIRMQQMQKE